MSLVADQGAVRGRPGAPGARELLQHQVGDRFAVIRNDTGVHLLGVTAEKRRELLAQIITAAAGELFEEARCPIGLALRIIDLVGVAEIRAQPVDVVSGVGRVERLQVVAQRCFRQVIDDEALGARAGPLDQFAMPALKQRIERPVALWGGPVEFAPRADPRREVDPLASIRAGHERHERQRLFVAHLEQGQVLQVGVRGERFFELGHRHLSRAGRAHDRSLQEGDRFGQALAGL